MWIDGELEIMAGVELDFDTVGVYVSYDGHVDFDGEVHGSCEIEVDAFAGSMVDEDAWSTGLTYEGHICGHDAAVVVGVRVER